LTITRTENSEISFKTRKTGCNNSFEPPAPPKRCEVLLALWNRAVWLDNTINKVEAHKRRVTPKLRTQIYMTQVHNQLCKTLLYGLKDEEIELQVIELEEKLKNGVLIPFEQHR